MPLLRLLRRLLLEPKQIDLRTSVAEVIVRQSGIAVEVKEGATDPISLKKTYQPVFGMDLATLCLK